jgi:hypothetical protein
MACAESVGASLDVWSFVMVFCEEALLWRGLRGDAVYLEMATDGV